MTERNQFGIRIPGAGAFPQGPARLPGVPAPPYDPPIEPPTADAPMASTGSLNGIENYESALKKIPFPSLNEFPVYTTQRRWRAIDVYLNALSAGAVMDNEARLSFAIYAIARGIRSIVAKGTVAQIQQEPVLWVAGARVQAERFEVTVTGPTFTNVNDPSNYLQISVVASDEADDLPPWVGLAELGAPRGEIQNGSKSTQNFFVGAPPMRLERVQAVNGAAANAPAYIQIFEYDNAAAMGVPMAVYALAQKGAAGSSVFLGPEDLPAWWFETGIAVVASSTPLTYTAMADVGIQAWYR